jgi:flagellar biosynthesis protein FliQ
VLAMMGPWMLNTLIAFTEQVWAHIPEMTASAS